MTTKAIIALLQHKVSLYLKAIENLKAADDLGVHVDEHPETPEQEQAMSKARSKAWARRKKEGEI
jgi:hypothetical protein